MRKVARKDTAPELALRRKLHLLGMRYYVHRRPLPGLRRQADVVFPRAKVAVFVDGCFWHGCPDHAGRLEKTNGWYWPAKIQGNKDRDADTNSRLEEAGWVAVRIWEHDSLETAALRIANLVRSRRPAPPASRAKPATRPPKPPGRAR
jgi:DNA mismatch endonuclease (patch repair protein)